MTDHPPRKVLVTGGGGFLGKAIIKNLAGRGDMVRSLSRGYYPELASLNIEQVRGDICDKSHLEMAFDGIELVFHTAAKAGVWGNYQDYHNTNVLGTNNVISACIDHHIPYLVHTSSPSVVFNGKDMEGVDESAPYAESFPTSYPKTKAIAEQNVVAASGENLKVIILRPHLIWGPGDKHFLPRIISRAKNLARIGKRKNLVDTIYIDNAADAHVLAAEKLQENPGLSGNKYFISQGSPIPIWDMINGILEAAGLPPVERTVPVKAAWLAGAMLEFIHKTFKLPGEPRMTRFVAEELSTSHWFNIEAARRDLGFNPRISIQEGLKYLGEWLHQSVDSPLNKT